LRAPETGPSPRQALRPLRPGAKWSASFAPCASDASTFPTA
jgi:hypothetical protein